MYAVLRHAVQRILVGAAAGAIDHLRVDAGLHRFEHVAAGQVDGRGQFEVEFGEFGLCGGDQRADHQRHVAAGEVMGLERLRRDALLFVDARLHRHNLAADNHRRIDLAEGHAQQVEDADARPRRDRLNPQAEIAGEDRQHDQRQEQNDHDADDR